MSEYYAVTYSDTLAHHGVKGQKWGVRRYENYDGTLTQRGLKRYRKAEHNYNYSKNRYKKEKARYKASRLNKGAVVNARREMNEDKRTLKRYYKQLHNDKMADKGKERYARGERISTRGGLFATVAEGAGIVAGIMAYSGNQDAMKKAMLVSAGSAAAYGLINAYAELPLGSNYQLRKYYAHKSLPDIQLKGSSSDKPAKPKQTSGGNSKASVSFHLEDKGDHYLYSGKEYDMKINKEVADGFSKKLDKFNNSKNPDADAFVKSLSDDELALMMLLDKYK